MTVGLLELAVKCNRTPDFIELKNSKFARHLVFVYDDLKRGRSNNFLMNGAELYGLGTTFENALVMKKTDQGMPAVFRPNRIKINKQGGVHYMIKATGQIMRSEELGSIEGELYSVSLRHLCELDKANLNGVVLQRRKMWVQLSSYPNSGKTAQAWVYLAIPEEFNKKWPIRDLRHVNLLRKSNINVHYT